MFGDESREAPNPGESKTGMLKSRRLKSLLALVLANALSAAPLVAQQKPPVTPRQPAAAVQETGPSFDALLAADTYKVYCEIRGVGGLVRSPAVNDLLEPLMKLGKPPKEFKSVVKWLNAHAEVLGGSRLMVAGWPSRPNLPTVLVAVEFSSPEEAKKFYPELRDFLPTLLPTPTPTPSPTPSPSPSGQPANTPKNESAIQYRELKTQIIPPTSEDNPAPAPPPYQMSRAGSLVFISDTAFAIRDLRPRGSKPLEEDQNFALARNRFASESLFLYFDLQAIQKEEQEQRKKWEEEEQQRAEAAAALPAPSEEPSEVTEPVPPEGEAGEAAGSVDEEMPSPEATVESVPSEPPPTGTLSGSPRADDFNPFALLLFGGLARAESTKWPEAIAAAVVFEGDAYVARVLLINSADNSANAIPFFPQFVSGPAIAPASPNVLPADVDLFVAASLDYVQIYDKLLPIISGAAAIGRTRDGETANEPTSESPFAAYEAKLGMKLRGDLLPLLGNELAVAVPKNPRSTPSETAKQPSQSNAPAAEISATPVNSAPNPIFAVSIKDREAVAKVLPKIIEALGIKGAGQFAQSEKRGSTEIVSYAGVFAYAFIDNFLVISPDPKDVRHVVDAYLNNETLSSNGHFKNFTRWQPRQVLGQVYVAPSLVEQFTLGNNAAANEKMRELLSRLNPVIDPLTYSLTTDGVGHLHELHVPKNLLQLLIAEASAEVSTEPLQANEAMAQSALRSLYGSEVMYRSDDARYGSLEELLSEKLVTNDLIENHGYRIDLIASKDKFEAIAIPLEYGKSGRLSFFIDESGILRAGDKGGGAATVADQPFNR